MMVAVAVIVSVTLAGCVGNARTTGAYRGKASHTAKAAVSALQTALLAVQISHEGNMLGPYLETVLSRAEDDLGSVQQQFDSIQPPNTAEADRLRSRLDALLSKGSDTLSQLRILSRRAEQAELEKTAEDIPDVVDALNDLARDTA
jgi:hypothetical protein